ncbi:hypothetical protein [Peribacillus sp. SCS-155]|uniref:hypothetical protein n=1 Tax=Peribacillus sedimenti TaxID=3115297 RepID=UPI0039069C94
MFDPTAFENMKVVVEGAVYDMDLGGHITVTDRKDIVDLSNLSRAFEIEAELTKTAHQAQVKARIILHASLENLAAELMSKQPERHDPLAGCTVSIIFHVPFQQDDQDILHIISLLEQIWGSKRIVEVHNHKVFSNQSNNIDSCTKASVSFGRIITEEQMDDVLHIAEITVETLKAMEDIIP